MFHKDKVKDKEKIPGEDMVFGALHDPTGSVFRGHLAPELGGILRSAESCMNSLWMSCIAVGLCPALNKICRTGVGSILRIHRSYPQMGDKLRHRVFQCLPLQGAARESCSTVEMPL